MQLRAPCVEHDKWLFAALVFSPVKAADSAFLWSLWNDAAAHLELRLVGERDEDGDGGGWRVEGGGGNGCVGGFFFWGTSPLTLSLPPVTGLE